MFISSTFRDMQAERDQLVRFVFPRLREELLKRHVHLVDVDLRWGVTSDEDALEACRAIIDECRPRFLCMLGGRYGWVPKGTERSITHDEIEYGAIGGAKRLDAHFFYFRDDGATASVPKASAAHFRDSKQNAEKLSLLKTRIRERGYKPYVYPARWDDPSGRFVGLEEFGGRVYADLEAAIEAELGPDEEGTIDEFEEENAAVDSFVESKTENYVIGSRRDVLDRMHRCADEGGLAAVVGEPGTGKSALMATFWRERQARKVDDKLVTHFVGASPSSTNVRLLLRRVCHELASIVSAEDDLPTQYDKLVEAFPTMLEKAAQRGRVVVLIDGVNQLRAPYEPRYMRWLPNTLADGVSILLSAPPGPELDALRDLHEQMKEVELEPLSPSDVVAITDGYLARYQKQLDAGQRSLLFAKNDVRRPLYLVAALEELRTLGAHDEITDRIRELPEQTQSLFRWILKRLEAEPGFLSERDQPIGSQIVPEYCALIATSRFGMSQAELVELVSPAGDSSGADSLGNVAALHRLLRPYLVERGDLLGFFHQQLEEAVTHEYLAEPAQQREKHRTLAFYFGRRADPGRDRTWQGNSRAISELPYHLSQAELWDDVFATLTDFTFLERKAAEIGIVESTCNDGSVRRTYTGVLELLDDYSLALDRFPPAGEAGALAVLAPTPGMDHPAFGPPPEVTRKKR